MIIPGKIPTLSLASDFISANQNRWPSEYQKMEQKRRD